MSRMGLTFAIRDDDTCFFTDPAALEAVYGAIWDHCPVSLAVVPFQACTRSGAVPHEHWTGDRVFPLADNAELVRFLREQISRGRVHVMLHGHSHRDEPGGYEFAAGTDLSRKVREGRSYLESLLGVRITAFVPPHNSIGRAGLAALAEAGLLLSGRTNARIQGARGRDLLRFAGIRTRERILRRPHPHVIRYSRHREVGFHALTPRSSESQLRQRLARAHAARGVFVLATHYWEFSAAMAENPARTQADLFAEIWRQVRALPDVRFAALGELA